MVNKTILNFISQNKQFPLFEIKNKVLSSGYNESDFNEAVKTLNLEKNKIKVKSKFRWKLIEVTFCIILLLVLLLKIFF